MMLIFNVASLTNCNCKLFSIIFSRFSDICFCASSRLAYGKMCVSDRHFTWLNWTRSRKLQESIWIIFPTIFTICRHLIFNFLRIRADLHMATCVFQIDISHDWTEQEVGSCKKSVWILFPTIFTTICRHLIFKFLRIRPDLHMATCVFQIDISHDWTEQEVGSCKKSIWILFPTIFTICRHLIFNFLRIRADLHMATCVFQIDSSHDWTEQEVGSCKKSVWILFATIFTTICRHLIFNFLRIRPDLYMTTHVCFRSTFQMLELNKKSEVAKILKSLFWDSHNPHFRKTVLCHSVCHVYLLSWEIDALLPLFL